MATRPVWKGQLRLSMVSIPVEMYSANVTGARVSFRHNQKPGGKPNPYEKAAGGGPVDRDDILGGYDLASDDDMIIDPEEIDAMKLETRKTIDLVQFVGLADISPLYYDAPFYLVPTDDLAKDAYRVVRDAMRMAGKVGLGQITLRGREHIAAVQPCGDGLLVETLRFADEVRAADPLFSGIRDAIADPDLLNVATALIDRKTAPFRAETFRDHCSIALREWIEYKRETRRTPRISTDGTPPSPSARVVDLMVALKQSLDRAGGIAVASDAPGPAATPFAGERVNGRAR